MKKTFFNLLALLLISTVGVTQVGCSSDGASHPAAKIEESIWKALKDGNAAKVADIMVKNCFLTDESEREYLEVEAGDVIEAMRAEDIKITKIEVFSCETIVEEDPDLKKHVPDSAEPKLRITLNTGEVAYTKISYVYKDKKWMRLSTRLELDDL